MPDETFNAEFTANTDDFVSAAAKVTESLNAVSAAADRVSQAGRGEDLSAIRKHMEAYREIDRIEREIRRSRQAGSTDPHPEEGRLAALKKVLPELEKAAEAEQRAADARAEAKEGGKSAKPAAEAEATQSVGRTAREAYKQAVAELNFLMADLAKAEEAVRAGGRAQGWEFVERPEKIAELKKKIPGLRKAALVEEQKEKLKAEEDQRKAAEANEAEKERVAKAQAAEAKKRTEEEKKSRAQAEKELQDQKRKAEQETERQRKDEQKRQDASRKQQEKDRSREEQASLGRLYALSNMLRSIGMYRMASMVTAGRRILTYTKRGMAAIAGEEGAAAAAGGGAAAAEGGALEGALAGSGLARFIPGMAAGGSAASMAPMLAIAGTVAAGIGAAMTAKWAWGQAKQYSSKAPLMGEYMARSEEEIPEDVLTKTKAVRAAGFASKTFWMTVKDLAATASEAVLSPLVNGMRAVKKFIDADVKGAGGEESTRGKISRFGWRLFGSDLLDVGDLSAERAEQQEREYIAQRKLTIAEQTRQYRIGVLSRIAGGTFESAEGALYGAPDQLAQQGAYVTSGIAAVTRETTSNQEQLIDALKDLTQVVKEGKVTPMNWTQLLGLGPNWSR